MSARGVSAGILALLFVLGASAAAAAPQVEARLSAASIDLGASASLVVTVSDAGASVRDPVFDVPDGIELLGRDRSQSFSWVNGRSSNEVVFRFELGATRVGRYVLGPIRVTAGNQTYLSSALSLEVTAPRPRSVSSSGRGPASLYVSVSPTSPYVGQLVQLRVQFVQRSSLAEDSQYVPPSTPGFWTESWSEPRNHVASEGGREVVVIERAQRIYPLAAGSATVGQAQALVTPATGNDPFFGGVFSQRMTIASDSFRVSVRPLPAGAPPEFAGAVGTYTVSWVLDRDHTAEDEAVTVRFHVRGSGGLPLLQTPAFAPPGFEVFAASSEDSLAPAGSLSPGRRSFVWTLLPKRSGKLSIAPPAFAWFDPEAGVYRRVTAPPLQLDVISASGAMAHDPADERFPAVFLEHRARPGARGAWGWLAALAGVALGAAVRLWRSASQPDADAPARARAREYLRAVGLARGPDFWRAADEAASWVEARGGAVLRLREDIAAARYGGQQAAEAEVRQRLVERIGERLTPEASPVPRRGMAVALAVLAIAAWAVAAPQGGPARLAQRAAEADAMARAGRLEGARSEWSRLWNEAPGDAALAARLGWADLQRGELAGAVRWVLLGSQGEPRDAGLAWSAARVREAGGLVGARAPWLPLRSLEWAALAFACALGLALEWPRRLPSAALLALALLCAAVVPAEHWAAERQAWLVIRGTTALEGADLSLDAGQVVDALGPEAAGRVRVRAGRDLVGTVPADSVLRVHGSTP